MCVRILSVLFMFLTVAGTAIDSSADKWEALSEIGTYGLVGAALSIPAYRGDWEGAGQAGLSVATASGVAQLGKLLVSEERPDKSDDNSFPSNHAANAFAAATFLQRRYGLKVGVPAYGIASLAGIGRVEADRHYWGDVLAGAVFGSLAGWVLTDSFADNVQVVSWAGKKDAWLAVSINW